MEILLAFINTYGVTIMYGILVGVGSYVGLKLKALVEQYLTDKQKRKVVESVVKAVEQMYHELDGSGKLEKAREGVVDLLSSKGIQITDFELRMLIESVVSGFNYSFGLEKTSTKESSGDADTMENAETADAAAGAGSDSSEEAVVDAETSGDGLRDTFLAAVCHWIAEKLPVTKHAAAQAGKQEEGENG